MLIRFIIVLFLFTSSLSANETPDYVLLKWAVEESVDGRYKVYLGYVRDSQDQRDYMVAMPFYDGEKSSSQSHVVFTDDEVPLDAGPQVRRNIPVTDPNKSFGLNSFVYHEINKLDYRKDADHYSIVEFPFSSITDKQRRQNLRRKRRKALSKFMPDLVGKASPYGSISFPKAVNPLQSGMSPSEVRRFQQKMQRGLNYRMSRFQSGLHQQMQEQRRRQALQQNHQNQVLNDLKNKMNQGQHQLKQQRGLLLHTLGQLFYKGNVGVIKKGKKTRTFRTKQLRLTKEGVERIKEKLKEQLERQEWTRAAKIATELFNPWSGVFESTSQFSDIDQNGILKGPLLKNDALNLHELALADPSLAHEIRETANTLQAYAKGNPYLMEFPQDRNILESASMMLKVSAGSLDRESMLVARDLLHSLTGNVSEKNYQIKIEGESYKFVENEDSTGTDYINPGDYKNIGKAAYQKLVSDRTWMASAPLSIVKSRSHLGSTIDVPKSIDRLAKRTLQEGRAWSTKNKVSFRVRVQATSKLNSPKTQAAYGQLKEIKSGAMPDSQNIMMRAVQTLELADQTFLSDGENSEIGNGLLSIAKGLGEIVVGLIPVVSQINDAYALFEGKSLLTQETLSNGERALALVGLLTGGLGSKIPKAWKVIQKSNKCCLKVGGKKVFLVASKTLRALREKGLETRTQIRGAVHYLRNYGDEVGGAGQVVALIKGANSKALAAYSKLQTTIRNQGIKYSAGTQKYIANTVRYSNKIFHQKSANNILAPQAKDLKRIADSREKLSKAMDRVPVKSFNEDVWRAVPENPAKQISNTDKDVFVFHAGVKRANHRYSAPEVEAIYGSMDKSKVKAWNTVIEELGEVADQPLRLISKKVQIDRLLDLTDPRIRNKLGVSYRQLTRDKDLEVRAYELTQQIGSLAKEKGFLGIKVPSAAAQGGTNIVIFGNK